MAGKGYAKLCRSLFVEVVLKMPKKNMAGESQVHIERIQREHLKRRSARRIA
jgi:hypothetical protein